MDKMKPFISKLIDRNLQRKRESGITSYVLFSVLIVCLYKLFKHCESLLISSEYSNNNLNSSIWLICYVFNFLFVIGGLSYLIFPINKNFNSIKLIKPAKTDAYIFWSMILSFPLSLILISYTFFTNQSKSIFLVIYCVLIFLLSLIGIINTIFLYKQNQKKNLIIESKKPLLKIIITTITFAMILIITISSAILIYSLDVEFKIEIIKIVTLIYLAYAIIERIFQNNTFDKYYLELEDFEYEITLRELDDKQIRKEFQQRFSGFLINDWILFQNNEFISRAKTLEEDITFYQDLIENNNRKYSDDLENPHFKKTIDSILQRIYSVQILYNDQNSRQIELLKSTVNSNFNEIESVERSRIDKLMEEIKNNNIQL